MSAYKDKYSNGKPNVFLINDELLSSFTEMTYLEMPSFIILSLTDTMLSTSLIAEMCEMLVKP